MTTHSIETLLKSKRAGNTRRAAGDKAALSRNQKSRAPVRKPLQVADTSSRTRITKDAQLLSLLSQHEGASIEDMMHATNWQQHSVRGFLAGTVKKKLGLELTSSKADEEPRRYRIVARRGR